MRFGATNSNENILAGYFWLSRDSGYLLNLFQGKQQTGNLILVILSPIQWVSSEIIISIIGDKLYKYSILIAIQIYIFRFTTGLFHCLVRSKLPVWSALAWDREPFPGLTQANWWAWFVCLWLAFPRLGLPPDIICFQLSSHIQRQHNCDTMWHLALVQVQWNRSCFPFWNQCCNLGVMEILRLFGENENRFSLQLLHFWSFYMQFSKNRKFKFYLGIEINRYVSSTGTLQWLAKHPIWPMKGVTLSTVSNTSPRCLILDLV